MIRRPLHPWRVPVALASIVLGACATAPSTRELAEEYVNLGNVYFETGDLERSFELFERALELDPSVSAASYNAARVQIERGQITAAIDLLAQLLRDDPDNVIYRETLAYALYSRGDVPDALREYRRVLTIAPGLVRAVYNMALIQLEFEQAWSAYHTLNSAADLAREDAEYQLLLADAAWAVRQENAAVQALQDAIAADADDLQLRIDAAARFLDWEFPLLTIEALLARETLVADDAVGAFLLARAYLESGGDFDAGRRWLNNAVSAGFDDSAALAELLDRLVEDERRVLSEDLPQELRPAADPEVDTDTDAS